MINENIEQSAEMTGDADTPTNRSQYIADQMRMGAKKQTSTQKTIEGLKRIYKEKTAPKMEKELYRYKGKILTRYVPAEKKKYDYSRFKKTLEPRKKEVPRGLPQPKISGRFYAPDSTWGQDDGQKRLGRFPIGKGYQAHIAPIVSTDANNQPRSRLGMKRPPMMDLQ